MQNVLFVVGGFSKTRSISSCSKDLHYKTINFFQILFNVNNIKEINNKIIFKNNHKSFPLFADPYTTSYSESLKPCYTPLVPILEREANLAGYNPAFAAIDDIILINRETHSVSIAKKWEKILEQISIVAISTSLLNSYEVLKQVVDLLKVMGKTIILGGVFLNILNKEYLYNLNFDFCFLGEAENLFSSLLILISKKPYSDSLLLKIPGLIWRSQDELYQSKFAREPVNLNTISYSPSEAWVKANNGIIPYESMRGCPYKCAFCSYPFLFNYKFRFKSVKKIFEDWLLLAHLGVKHIECFDSTFTTPVERLTELCHLLSQSGLNKVLSWSAYARTSDLLNPIHIKLMKDSGCKYLFLGIESGDQNILNNMNKKTTIKENAEVIKRCNQEGIFTTSSFIIGFPGENTKSVNNTKKFLHHNYSPSTMINIWMPDCSFNSKVPIMQSANKKKFRIVSSARHTSYLLQIYGHRLSCNMDFNWKHNTMAQEQALKHIADIAEMIKNNLINTEDYCFAPYRAYLAYNHHLSTIFDYNAHLNFIIGLKKLYNCFMLGKNTIELRHLASRWLSSSECSLRT